MGDGSPGGGETLVERDLLLFRTMMESEKEWTNAAKLHVTLLTSHPKCCQVTQHGDLERVVTTNLFQTPHLKPNG